MRTQETGLPDPSLLETIYAQLKVDMDIGAKYLNTEVDSYCALNTETWGDHSIRHTIRTITTNALNVTNNPQNHTKTNVETAERITRRSHSKNKLTILIHPRTNHKHQNVEG